MDDLNPKPALAETQEAHDRVQANAERLCRLTLRNQAADDALTTLLGAALELLNDECFRARPAALALARARVADIVRALGDDATAAVPAARPRTLQ